ncbi:hypothetical protein [Streptomyces albidus (ex Kaewkla and Franco 2022)]|uniref:hypothetical protein n=1 Tax=Streptomyces albidus (ex Kaewkla and Franco 2022) TaxID=722709 RepID=UPI0015EFC5A7|nr:hypothetical protein [Streptomyces albidus (ex Kaewkla and Franco 2022)]
MERQIRSEHIAQLREPRRKAYADFAAETSASLRALDKMHLALSKDPPLHDEVVEQLVSIEPPTSIAYERVSMEGPEDVAWAAAKVGMAITDAYEAAFDVIDPVDTPAPSAQDAAGRLAEAVGTAKQAKRDFQLLVLQAVRADGAEPELDQARHRLAAIKNTQP